MIDEKKLIEEIKSMVRPLLTPDGTAYLDDTIQVYNETIVDVLNTIEKQPKVGEWIPVEERTPENLEFVDITFTFVTFFGEIKYLSSVAKYDGYFWWDTYGEVIDGDVIAWKPRSKPMIKKQKNDFF